MRNKKISNDIQPKRSQKVRTLLSEFPQSLLWIGWGAVIAISLGLLASFIFIEYPYSNGESILQHIINNL
ncbi:MAG: hypothetical protein NC453_20940 [Muribaculum sp.]|nr:hypothetical protein [Muribaculum sp.]